jgi:hypothetical protein
MRLKNYFFGFNGNMRSNPALNPLEGNAPATEPRLLIRNREIHHDIVA